MMNPYPLLQSFRTLPERLFRGARGMFNLNDSRWGRDEGGAGGQSRPEGSPPPAAPGPAAQPPAAPPSPPPAAAPQRPRNTGPQGQNQGPPDLDELWRDFNRKLGGLFGGR